MSDDLNYIYNDLEETAPARESSMLNELSSKVEEVLNLEDDISVKEEELNELKERHKQLTMGVIPDIFHRAGLTSAVLDNKYRVSVVQDVSGKVLDQRKFAELLEKRGQDSLNKTSLVLGKVPAKISKEIAAFAFNLLGEYPEIDTSIHYQTLKKWLRENLMLDNHGEGSDCADKVALHDLDGIVEAYTYSKAKVTPIKS